MKNLKSLAVTAASLVLAVAAGCYIQHRIDMRQTGRDHNEKTDSLPSERNDSSSIEIPRDTATTGAAIIKKPVKFKNHTLKNGRMLIGNFTGMGIDTLHVIPAETNAYARYLTLTAQLENAGSETSEWERQEWQDELDGLYDMLYDFEIVSSDPSVSAIPFKNGSFRSFPKLVAEGDLDGDGLDEVGCLREQDAGAEQAYRIYTWRNGQWRFLVPTLSAAGQMYPPGFDIAQPTGKRGKVRVFYPDYSEPGSCAANVRGKARVISTSLRPLDKETFLKY